MTHGTGPFGRLNPSVSWHGPWASNPSRRSSRAAGWASPPPLPSLLCIWLATASLPSPMRPGRSGGLIRLIRSNEESDEREATERNGSRARATLPPVTGLEYAAYQRYLALRYFYPIIL